MVVYWVVYVMCLALLSSAEMESKTSHAKKIILRTLSLHHSGNPHNHSVPLPEDHERIALTMDQDRTSNTQGQKTLSSLEISDSRIETGLSARPQGVELLYTKAESGINQSLKDRCSTSFIINMFNRTSHIGKEIECENLLDSLFREVVELESQVKECVKKQGLRTADKVMLNGMVESLATIKGLVRNCIGSYISSTISKDLDHVKTTNKEVVGKVVNMQSAQNKLLDEILGMETSQDLDLALQKAQELSAEIKELRGNMQGNLVKKIHTNSKWLFFGV